jgi:hypothetical protein
LHSVLGSALLFVETILLDGMFGVMAGVGFVGQQRYGRVDTDGQVGVELDARPVTTQVPVVGRPGLFLYQV